MDNEERKKGCTKPRILLVSFLLLVVVLGVVLLVVFVPGDDNDTKSNLEDTNFPTSSPTDEPTKDEDIYEPITTGYFRCNGNNLDNCCNGLDTPGVCDLRLDEMLFATAHNAMSTEVGGYPVIEGITGPNHKLPLEDALEAGYRGLSIDVCNCNGILELCHGVCNLGSRDPTEVFTNIVGFLQDHPTEFLMFNIQIDNKPINGAEVDIQDLYDLMMSVDGFYDMVYVETNRQTDVEWPTLRTLLHDQEPKKQIVMFQFDTGVNGRTCDDDKSCPEGLHYWFHYGSESEYSFVTKQDLEDIPTSCKVTRGNPVESRGFLGVTNFVSPPNETIAEEINAREFIEKRLEDCSTFNNNVDINALFIDFWSIGDLLEVTQDHNTKLGAAKQEQRQRHRAATTTTKNALRTSNN